MPYCSFCGCKENKESPLCQSCGALRYPVEKNKSLVPVSTQNKLKISATVAAAIVTPGSLILLALVGANKLNTKIKNKNR